MTHQYYNTIQINFFSSFYIDNYNNKTKKKGKKRSFKTKMSLQRNLILTILTGIVASFNFQEHVYVNTALEQFYDKARVEHAWFWYRPTKVNK